MITKEYEDNRKFMEVVRFFRNLFNNIHYKYDIKKKKLTFLDDLTNE
jgi:hypothetical protein